MPHWLEVVLVIVHVLAATVWVGGTIALTFIAVPAIRMLAGEPRQVAMRNLGPRWRAPPGREADARPPLAPDRLERPRPAGRDRDPPGVARAARFGRRREGRLRRQDRHLRRAALLRLPARLRARPAAREGDPRGPRAGEPAAARPRRVDV